ncbi:hypothetical protein JCGZ_13656 [Jatropha curcas]|uniref:Epidermal patterning factor-like protein n=1 Tax=Jatropha curcas TaxID=180498 RepID=A0A067KDI5_JATCU|nr:hypothetical protein JCGZ_13656 [Jatropha curcas]
MSFHQKYTAALLFFFLLLLLLLSAASSVNFKYGSLLFEKKAILDSTPPSCQDKCHGCQPCRAVQVPEPNPPPGPIENPGYIGDPGYKPIVWKCKCGGKF